MDIIIDLETLGTEAGCTVFQIAASEFDITTGELVGEPFDCVLDFSRLPIIIGSGSTLKFWLSSTHNQNILQNLIKRGFSSEQEMWTSFGKWLSSKRSEVSYKNPDLCLWGNGISFDLVKVKEGLGIEQYNKLVSFWNERDARTLVDMYCRKSNCSPWDLKEQYKNGAQHDAMADIIWEAKYLSAAFNGLNVREVK